MSTHQDPAAPGTPGDPAFLLAAALAGLGPALTPQLLAAGLNTNPAGTERLREYWTTGEGGRVKVRWGTEGAFTRCVGQLRKYLPVPGMAEGFCATACKRATGSWPGEGESSAPNPA